jgi:hypothetical protein
VGEQIVHAVILIAIAAAVACLGRWGRANAMVLVPDHLEVFDRERRIRSLERGAVACYAAAAVLLGAAVLALV